MGEEKQTDSEQTMSEKFCLKWNDFQENVNSTIRNLRQECEFSDVTLACEDGQQVEAHKFILAASSPFFQNLLRRNNHPHPLIYMRGMKSDDLVAIVDFIYSGEASVSEANLDDFLATADELDLKGMSGGNKEKNKPGTKPELKPNVKEEPNTKCVPENVGDVFQELSTLDESGHGNPVDKSYSGQGTVALQSFGYSDQGVTEEKSLIQTWAELGPGTIALLQQRFGFTGNLQELDGQINSLMKKGDNSMVYGKRSVATSVCTVCGAEGQTRNIREHIEAKHIEGINLPCTTCDKTYRTRSSRRHHKCKASTNTSPSRKSTSPSDKTTPASQFTTSASDNTISALALNTTTPPTDSTSDLATTTSESAFIKAFKSTSSSSDTALSSLLEPMAQEGAGGDPAGGAKEGHSQEAWTSGHTGEQSQFL